MNKKINVMLVDDHEVVRSGLRRLLEQNDGIDVVVEAESGEQAYQLYGEHLPDVVVMDMSMPGMGGLEALRRIIARYPQARVIIFSMHENAAYASQALSVGARAYVPSLALRMIWYRRCGKWPLARAISALALRSRLPCRPCLAVMTPHVCYRHVSLRCLDCLPQARA